LLVDELNFIPILAIGQVLLAIGLVSSAFLGLLKFELDPLLILLQLGNFVLEVEDAEVKILVFVLEFLDIRGIFLALLEVFDLLLLLPALTLQLQVVAF
jgi:hypothetical protein